MAREIEISKHGIAYSGTSYAGDQISLVDPDVLRNPYPTYNKLRSEHPVYWSGEINHWVVTRHDDVTVVLQDHKRFSNKRAHTVILDEHRGLMDPFVKKLSLWMSFMDPPDHTRIRSLLNSVFTYKHVQSLHDRIQGVVDFLLDPIMPRREMDLVKDFAYPLPAIVISEMLGSGIADRDRIKKWSYDIAVVAGVTNDAQALKTGQESMLEETEYFRELVAARRKAPTNDLISLMISAQEKEDRLSDDEIVAQCIMTILAGHETTESLIASGVYSLCRFPEQFDMLIADRRLLESAIPEMLRFESPLQGLTRIATTDVELRGKHIKNGDSILVLLGAANRDPEKFDNPERFDITREKNKHLAFGKGIHMCLGVTLARIESMIAFETILSRMPHMILVDHMAEWSANNIIFRGLRSLPVTF